MEKQNENQQTSIVKNRDKLSKKDLMDIINSQSEQILGLKQFIDDMKNDNMEIFRGNCDPEKKQQSTEITHKQTETR